MGHGTWNGSFDVAIPITVAQFQSLYDSSQSETTTGLFQQVPSSR